MDTGDIRAVDPFFGLGGGGGGARVRKTPLDDIHINMTIFYDKTWNIWQEEEEENEKKNKKIMLKMIKMMM